MIKRIFVYIAMAAVIFLILFTPFDSIFTLGDRECAGACTDPDCVDRMALACDNNEGGIWNISSWYTSSAYCFGYACDATLRVKCVGEMDDGTIEYDWSWVFCSVPNCWYCESQST